MKMTSAVLAALAAAFVAVTVHAQVVERPLPRLVQKDGRFALFVDDAPFLILCVEDQDIGLESTWPGRAKEWSAMDYLNANTVEVPIYWDEFEPQPGQYNYASIDRLLAECAPAQRPPDAALVRHVQERQPALHARMDAAGPRPLFPRGQPERAGGGLAFAVRHRLARGGQAGVRRVHATPQGGRPAAHRDHGSGGE